MSEVTKLWETTLNAYLKQLEDPNLSEEERRDIRDRIDEGNRRIMDKESENKNFLFHMDGNKKRFVLDVAKGIGGAAVAVLAFANRDKLQLPRK